MLLNYLKLSLRRLGANPFFSAINLLGLSTGFAAFFILWQHTTTELSVDRHYKDYDRIGRLGCVWSWKEDVSVGQMTCGSVPVDQMARIADDFPQIVDYTRMDPMTFGNTGGYSQFVFTVVSKDDERASFKETSVASADSNFFSFFNIPLVYGTQKDVLRNGHTVALSRTTAERYFGPGNPVNRILVLNDSITLDVSGVFEDFGRNTHLNFNIIFSNSGYRNSWDTKGRWGLCYFKLAPHGDFRETEAAIQANKQKYWAAELESWILSDGEHFIQPLTEVAFSNHYWGDYFWPRSKFTLHSLVVVAVLILLMAWINYLNLTISRLGRRWKEISARKVNGAGSRDLLAQFTVEAAVNHALAIGMALTLVQLIRQPMITLFNIEIPDLSNTPMSGWLVIAVAALAGMALTTLYPVFILMAHQPRAIFRQQKGNTGRIVSFALTTFQYSAAVVLVLWVSVVFFQLDFILHKDLGFDRANVAIINVPATGSAASEERFVSLMNTLRSRYQATYGQTLMGDDEHMRVKMKSPKQRDYFQVDSNGGVDETFVPFFGLRVLAGRNFIQGDRADALIVGRYVANRLGYPNPEDAIGAKIQVENKESTLLEVIGVIEDFSLRPFVNYGEDTGHPNKTRDDGVILSYKNGSWPEMVPGKIAIRLSPKNFQADVKDLGEMFSRYFPNAMFTWTLHEDHINRQYNQEKVLGGQTSLLAAVAIGIACLGLIGMISNTVEEKTKELGIRKVFGAGLTKVASVLLKPTIRQLLIAIIAGLPIGLYLGTQYLERYSLRVALQWWHLAIPLSILILTMVAAVAYSLFNAVRANPVDSLRCE